jgi:hypothetical protein
MSILTSTRQEPITVNGVELVVKPMTARRHLELAKLAKNDDNSFPLQSVFECIFLPDGQPAFSSAAEVGDLDSPTFFELVRHVNRVNAWSDEGSESVKKN